MPITAALCTSYKKEILDGTHLAADTYKLALYTSAATLGASTTAWTASNEVSASGTGYTVGGATLSGYTTTTSGAVAFADFTSDPVWAAANITARGGLIYKVTRANRAVCVLDFGGDITSTTANFSVAFPAADSANALIRLS
jgi:hypothetical protein